MCRKKKRGESVQANREQGKIVILSVGEKQVGILDKAYFYLYLFVPPLILPACFYALFSSTIYFTLNMEASWSSVMALYHVTTVS
jgi:hypothetical protein